MKAYVMSVASYHETPGWAVEEQKENKLKDLSNYDELTSELLTTQQKLISEPWNKELKEILNKILTERTAEEERLKSLYNPELVSKFTSEELQNYANKLNEFQNIRLARIEAQKDRNERLAKINEDDNIKLANWEDSLKSFIINEENLAQEQPKEKTDKTKPLEEKDINFLNKKDNYLPWSAYKEWYIHKLTKNEVIKVLDWKNIKDFQKENNLKDDWIIGGKTYLAIIKALKIEKWQK